MQRQGPGWSWADLTARLDERDQRVHALEAENQELRRQLENLRQGVGIALVIEGRTMPLTAVVPSARPAGPAPAGADPVAPPPGPAAYGSPETLRYPAAPARANGQRPGAVPFVTPPATPGAPVAHAWPGGVAQAAFGVSQPEQLPHGQYGSSRRDAEQWPYVPLASRPEELPALASLVPPPVATSGAARPRPAGAWPGEASGRAASVARPPEMRQPQPQPVQRHPLRGRDEQRPERPGLFADDRFLL